MARLIVTAGQLETEVLAPKLTIDWNSQTNEAVVIFRCVREIRMDGAVVATQPDRVLERVVDPANPRMIQTQVGLDAEGLPIYEQFPETLAMAIIKGAFEQFYAEEVPEFVAPPLEQAPQ